MPPVSADSYRQHRASHVEFPASSIRPSMDQTSDSSIGAFRSRVPLPPKTLIGFSLAVIAVVIIALLSYQSLQATTRAARNLTQSIEMLTRLQGLLSTLKDAETGQRGYLLTGEESYLSPYTDAKDALPGEFNSIREALRDRPEPLRQLDALESLANLKMAELESTVAARRAGHPDAALAMVRTERGRIYMDRIRAAVNDMMAAERQAIAQLERQSQNDATISLAVTWGGSGLLLILSAGAAVVAARDSRARQAEAWIRSGQMGLSEQMRGDQSLEKLGNNLLGFLAGFVEAQVGAVYIAEAGHYRRFAGYALPADASVGTIRPGDGLVGQAARDYRAVRLREVPPGYLPISSSLGQGTPGELLVVPAAIDGVVQAVMELGFFGATEPEQRELLSRASESIAVAVRAAKDRQRLEELLQETQQQAEELQSGQEELRAGNEELEEQGQVLRESQENLQIQQAELEQINSQLEEQTRLLQHQKDALAKAHEVSSARSDELQRANEYKSEFLANMSHELRTPLNSTLILAKLLADNKDGNLTQTQVKYAQTIKSAGNDLLRLINDVLDLSRIEAGKVELAPERLRIAGIVESLAKTFEPTAEQNGLSFSWVIERSAPEQIETDARRLGQILKNLLSNAFKFTEKGEVALRVFSHNLGAVSFAVRDTGVGIAPHQQEVIFEAFRQADGSIHRKFGGTGLGLSISRDLAALLGGAVTLQSTRGAGSVFTLTLPITFTPRTHEPPDGSAPEKYAPGELAASGELAAPVMDDERETIKPGGRSILLVEDDPRQRESIRHLLSNGDVQITAVAGAGDALAQLKTTPFDCMVVDLNLPDYSGYDLLEKMSQQEDIAFPPVIIYTGRALTREEEQRLRRYSKSIIIKDARSPERLLDEVTLFLHQVEAKFPPEPQIKPVRHREGRLEGRRVLVVEDDVRNVFALASLLEPNGVIVLIARNGREAIDLLARSWQEPSERVELVLMDIMMPEMDGLSAMREIRKRAEWKSLPIIALTAKAMADDREKSLAAGANDYIAKPLDVEKLLSLVHVWMPK
jgi:signal transduction histidine kinase/DNA-binding response OmpR family regulator/CHASE3 domain sensor protein